MQEDEIMDVICDIGDRNNVRILYACESGSRAYGFESPDSDYDVRFVYIRPVSEYLSLHQPHDVIEARPTDELDIVGWDIRKFLTLMRKSNPSAFEWLESPIVYHVENSFCDAINPVSWRCFSPYTSAHHYAGIATGAMRAIENGDRSPKKFLYALRGILGAQWGVAGITVPVPVRFEELWDAFDDGEMAEKVDNLLRIKREWPEIEQVSIDDELFGWMRSSLEAVREDIKLIPATPAGGWGLFDEAFRKIAFL